jgi:PAS domain S-box-containing protein
MLPLAGMRVESYLGLPLQATDGTTLGHLFLADDMPMVNLERIEFVARVMARRASLELQRMTALASAPPPSPPRTEHAGEPGDAARDEEARLRSGMEGMPTAVVMTDEQGVVAFVNPRLEELAGRTAEDLVGRRAWPLLLSGGPWQVQNEEYTDAVVRPDKTRIAVSVYAIPCRDAGGRISGTLGVLTPRGEPKARRAE